MLDRFGLAEARSDVRTEVQAGVATFMAMAYIVVVNPAILADAGMDGGAVFVATCLAAAIGSVLMGLLANYPVALAPGMGQNAFFTYGIVIGTGQPWQTALGAVFVSGVIFVALSVLPVREWLINAIPRSLKYGIAAGVGLFIGFIALKNAGIVVDDTATLVAFGELAAAGPLLAIAGFVLIVGLSARGVTGAVLFGILAVTVVGWLLGAAEFGGIVSLPPDPRPVLGQLDIGAALQWSMVTVILTLLLVDVFDTAGTLVGVAARSGLMTADGHLPRLRSALLSDSGATLAGAVLGTSSTTSYIESGAGVAAGGRTGLTAVVTGCLFLACLFFAPLAGSVPAFATASALLFVATIMARALADVDWEDYTEYAPAVVTALAMPLSFSIADGIGLGFISYALAKGLAGRPAECPLAVWVVAAIFAAKFLLL
ncbi:MAG: NCS2 family permease [Pseudomonadales bacterium]|jgi:AGZA family xanthine/uracil permease-like MFS transporter|nr:NCS2 family permease [Pseudomonadales bacterium]